MLMKAVVASLFCFQVTDSACTLWTLVKYMLFFRKTQKHKNNRKNRNNFKTLLSKFQGVYLTDSFNIAPSYTVITEEIKKKYNYHRRQPKTDTKDQNPDLDYVQKR